MISYFDTHAHYDDHAFDQDRDEVLSGLPGKGVALVVCPGSDMESSKDCVRLAGRYSYVYAAVGVHPHDAQNVPWPGSAA
jgi:TatD DNase family protein